MLYSGPLHVKKIVINLSAGSEAERWKVTMSEESLPEEAEQSPSAKLDQKMKQWLEELFDEYRKEGFSLTPDEAVSELELVLQKFVASVTTNKVPLPVRFNGNASRSKLHHHAVDLYYGDTRGAPSLSDDYLGRVLQLASEGTHPAKIARMLGQTDAKAEGRIRKQIDEAGQRFSAVAKRIRKFGATHPASIANTPEPPKP
jgi:hypothetical protein